MTAHDCESQGCTNPDHRESLADLLHAQNNAVVAYGKACIEWGAVPVSPASGWVEKHQAATAAFDTYSRAAAALARRVEESS